MYDASRHSRDVWIHDFARNSRTRLSSTLADGWSSRWSPAGDRIVFSARRTGLLDLFQRPANGVGDEQELGKEVGNNRYANSWSAWSSCDVVRPSNLRLLKDAGVQIVVGSDNVEDVGAGEFDYLASLGVFTNVELVRLWSETTPQAIFPKRRIGRIAPGYEASFIVLSRNPLDDLAATDEIVRRFKHGVEIVAAR